tara:strand:- start:41 stop:223 length:183 start_codon:yes stop_codon:yes gene_type:complete
MKIKITSAKLKNSEFQDTVIESLILEINGVKWGVPKDPDNQMYQAYLDWVAEGNTPDPAD